MRTGGFTSAVVAIVAALAASSPAAASLLVTIDKSAQRMTVALDGLPIFDWPVSTGKRGYDTPSGEFKPFRMEKDHFSREWDDAPMPHSVFFTKRGHAIHGTTHLKAIGQPASHGCVRLAPENAELLFKLVKQEGLANTRVVLHGTTTPSQPGVAAAPGSGEDFTAALPPRANRNGPAFSDGEYYYDRRGRRYSGRTYREAPRYYYSDTPRYYYREPPRYYYRAPPHYERAPQYERDYYVEPQFRWGR